MRACVHVRGCARACPRARQPCTCARVSSYHHLRVGRVCGLSERSRAHVLLVSQPERHRVENGQVDVQLLLPLGHDGHREELERQRRRPAGRCDNLKLRHLYWLLNWLERCGKIIKHCLS